MRFPIEEYQRRWQGVHDELEKRGLETAVIWQRSGGGYDRLGDVFWLSNYISGESGQLYEYDNLVGLAYAAVIMRRGHEPELHITEPVETIHDGEVAIDAIFHHQNLAEGLAKRLRTLGIEGDVGYLGDDFLPIRLYRELVESTPGINWVAVDELLFPIKKVKSARELDVYREGGRIVSKALSQLMDALIAGKPESVAAARAATIVMESGGGFHRIGVNHGERSKKSMWSDNLYGFRTDAAEPGELVRGWVYGPIHQGYWLDPGRIAVAGNKPSPQQKKTIEGAVRIVEQVMDEIKPGITPRQLGKRGDEVALKEGFDKDKQEAALWDIYGHSVGTYFEPPMIPAFKSDDERFSWGVDEPLEAGMVLGIETFLTHPDVGTASLEENCIITESGCEVITTTPKIFW